ncbi:hypothetical protein Ait01nite_020380 [Actinoplanes italicus]|uniref:Uncharacterized protein n=1 Tax=Actinoplanes italicus TaxID=113567 RepID=A0A2T0KP87_9ACTN|nr:hypothetical protein [Actinoplanes italicus]PRX25563.1 hypothetical protein CLV67_101280 [Actinoplanes italicus]GIE28993.1 hypothetical protein Ait01nite_020380 [Actinoplanes italicus]
MSTDDPKRDILAYAGVSQLAAGVQTYEAHRPGPDGCVCGKQACRSRLHATKLLNALGVDVTALTPAHAAQSPWRGPRVATVGGSPAPASAGSPKSGRGGFVVVAPDDWSARAGNGSAQRDGSPAPFPAHPRTGDVR